MAIWAVPVFPAASCAVTVIRFMPLPSGTLNIHELVPFAVPRLPSLLFIQVTFVTAMSSPAMPAIVTDPPDVVKLWE